MIFDGIRLWLADRRDKKGTRELRTKYQPLLRAAQETKNTKERDKILSEWSLYSQFDRRYESLRTHLLVKKAKRLGLPIPPKPQWNEPELEDDTNWDFNDVTGAFILKSEAELNLRREIRREEVERLQHQMRWVSQVVIPIIGLIGAFMGLLSLIHALK